MIPITKCSCLALLVVASAVLTTAEDFKPERTKLLVNFCCYDLLWFPLSLLAVATCECVVLSVFLKGRLLDGCSWMDQLLLQREHAGRKRAVCVQDSGRGHAERLTVCRAEVSCKLHPSRCEVSDCCSASRQPEQHERFRSCH